MLSLFHYDLFGRVPSDAKNMTSERSPDTNFPAEGGLLRTIGWLAAGAGALALGLFVGRELRMRYKFSRRTPYDFYAHSGDPRELEFGVGI